MKYSKVTGFILKRTNFSESDRIVAIFTKKHGKLRAIAKGIRKVASRRGPHLELFNLVSIFINQGNSDNYYITETEAIKTFSKLRKDINKVAVAYQMTELVERFSPENQKNEKIYILLNKGLNYLDNLESYDKKLLFKVAKRFTSSLLVDLGFIDSKSNLDPEEYAETILERRLTSPSFLKEISNFSSTTN